MPRPNITAGIWFRNARWPNGTQWRTDIPPSVFSDPFVRAARFALSDGPVVQIHAPERDAHCKVGPFNIDPFDGFIEVLRCRTKVQMDFGPFLDFDRDEIRRREGGYVSRPLVTHEFHLMADIVLDRIRSGRISYGQFVERVQEVNPALVVVCARDGSVSRDEITYIMRVNNLRAVKNFEQELLY